MTSLLKPPHAQGPVQFSERRDGSPERGEFLGSSPLVEGAGEGGVSTGQLQASSPVVTYTRSPPPTEPRYVAGNAKAALVSSAVEVALTRRDGEVFLE